MDLVERGSLPERYEIVAPAGRGGMGVVFRGFDHMLARSVALKFLAAGGPIDLAVALREARALAQLSHEGVLRVFDVIEGPEGVWIVMEWLEGRSLEALPRPGTLPEVLALAWRLLETLAAVHEAGIVHRDIKPSNIMICASGRAVLIDFGVAFLKGANSGFTLAGTPRYSAPWCFEGEIPGRASDLFSLALVLLELLSGHQAVPDLAPIPLYRFLKKRLPNRVDELLDGQFPPVEGFVHALIDDEKGANHASEAAGLLRQVSIEEPSTLLRRWVMGEIFPWAPVKERLRQLSENAIASSPRERARWLSFQAGLDTIEAIVRTESVPTALGTRHRREARARRIWVSLVALLAVFSALAALGAKLLGWGSGLNSEATLLPVGTASTAPPLLVALTTPQADVEAAPLPRAEATVFAEDARVPARVTPRPRPRLEAGSVLPTIRKPQAVAHPPCAVQFSANVWARLFVDGSFLAQLPTARSFAISPGKHRVRLENPMMDPLEVEVRVPVADEERFHFSLTPLQRGMLK